MQVPEDRQAMASAFVLERALFQWEVSAWYAPFVHHQTGQVNVKTDRLTSEVPAVVRGDFKISGVQRQL